MRPSANLFLSAALMLWTLPAAGFDLDRIADIENRDTRRASSHDRTGGNADALGPLAPGSSTVLLETTGPGVIRHMWFTASSFAGHDLVLRDLVLRMTWDDASVPAVETPLGDFFALGHGKCYTVQSMPVAVGANSRALNCYWPMPFRKNARIELINNGTRSVRSLYYNIDYDLGPVSDDAGLFHAVYQPRRELSTQAHEGNLTGTDNYVLLEAEGEGQYVGCALFVDAVPGGWWGEGDEMIFIDGDEAPTIIGTGSEDYFCNAWGYTNAFSYPFYGAPLMEKRPDGGTLATVYRWHLPDPVRFRKSIRVTIERLFGGNAKNDYSSVAFWYQREPIQSREPLPQGEANHPRLHEEASIESRLRVDGTQLEPALRKRGIEVQCVRVTGGLAHGGGYLELNSGKDTVEIPVPVPVEGNYDARLLFMDIEDGGKPNAGISTNKMTQAKLVKGGPPQKQYVRIGPVRSRDGTITIHVNGGKVGLDVIELKRLPTEFHVSPQGNDTNAGTESDPLKTISAAAKQAYPGDVITVHEGTYRERINPLRGGNSDAERITYQAAPGETVSIRGSEIVTGWEQIDNGIWKVTLPESFFGAYNPYRDVITGDWFSRQGRDHHTGEVYLDGKALAEAATLDDLTSETERKKGRQWYCAGDETSTTIWADFRDADPNAAAVEINVRETCFYPDQPGRNFITVRGFRMSQAATQWAAPTAEQPGLIGTHWSKGWIIEDNVVSDSKCVGITLGKDRASGHNDAGSADGYNEVVRRALAAGWSKEKIGSHIVRNNTIFECGAAGICGSMGAAFSSITGNHIHHIHLDKPFSGAEQAGIKFHGAIDTVIANNYIHHTNRGIWLDWMSQGTRVSSNLCHDNGAEDIFFEVNHGPYMVDNNIFLTRRALLDMSEGGAFAHNLLAGTITCTPEPSRLTPYHKAHTTEIAGLADTKGGDNRFYNNIFLGNSGLQAYDEAEFPLQVGGNVYIGDGVPWHAEERFVGLPEHDAALELVEEEDAVYLHLNYPTQSHEESNPFVTTELLGDARVPNLGYVNSDDTPLSIDRDYFGRVRNKTNPSAGPFEDPAGGAIRVKVWPAEHATQ